MRTCCTLPCFWNEVINLFWLPFIWRIVPCDHLRFDVCMQHLSSIYLRFRFYFNKLVCYCFLFFFDLIKCLSFINFTEVENAWNSDYISHFSEDDFTENVRSFVQILENCSWHAWKDFLWNPLYLSFDVCAAAVAVVYRNRFLCHCC